MLEIARLFAAGPRPQRTLVFAAWTGEERGLLGSEYYAQHPLFPMETMVANLTFDTLQFVGPGHATSVLVGRGQSEMEDYLAAAAKAQGRYVTPENHPERGLFYRADHFSFAKRGVPVLLDMALAGAYDLVDGGRAAGERWLERLHRALATTRPATPGRPSWNLRGAAQEAELFYAIGDARSRTAATGRSGGPLPNSPRSVRRALPPAAPAAEKESAAASVRTPAFGPLRTAVHSLSLTS